MESLWPDPIVTPQELIEGHIEQAKIAVLNREQPQSVVDELQHILYVMKSLDIGGRSNNGIVCKGR